MPASWKDITTSEGYNKLPPEGKQQIKTYFFEKRIAPSLAKVEALNKFSRDDIFQVWMNTPDDSGQGAFTSGVSAVGRGVLSPLSGITGGLGYILDSEDLITAGEDIDASINEMLPMNPVLQDTMGMKILGAAGQAISVIGTGGVGGVTGKVLGGVNAINRGAKVAVLASGGIQGAREGGQVAEQYGMEGGARAASILTGAGKEILTEMLPFGTSVETGVTQIFKGVPRLSKANLMPITPIVSEGLEESSAQVIQNAATKVLAPEGVKTPGLFEGAGEAGVLGMAGGVTFAGANKLMGRKAVEVEEDEPQLQRNPDGSLVRAVTPPKEPLPPVNTVLNGKPYHRDVNGAWNAVEPPQTEGASPLRLLDPVNPVEGSLIVQLNQKTRKPEATQPAATPKVQTTKPVEIDASTITVPPSQLGQARQAVADKGMEWASTADLSAPVTVVAGETVSVDDAVKVIAAQMSGRPVLTQPAVVQEQDGADTSATGKQANKKPEAPASAPPDAAMLAQQFKPGNAVSFKKDGQTFTGVVSGVNEDGSLSVNRDATGKEFTVQPQDVSLRAPESMSPSQGDVHTAVRIGNRVTTTPGIHLEAILEHIRRNFLPAHQRSEDGWREKADEWLVKHPDFLNKDVEMGFVINGEFHDRISAKKKLNDMGVQTPLADTEQRPWLDSADIDGLADLRTPAEIQATQEENAALLNNINLPSEPGTRGWGTEQIKLALYQLSNDQSMPRAVRVIADMLSRMSFSPVVLNIVADARLNYAGLYEPTEDNKGIISLNLRKNGRNNLDVRYSLVHEMLHHVTTWKVHLASTEFEKQQVEKLGKLLKRAKAYAAMQADRELNQRPSRQFDYELSNIDEFIAGLFTREDFQQFLASIPADATPSMMGRVRSVLQEIFRIIAELITGHPVQIGSLLDESVGSMLNLMHGEDVARQGGALPPVSMNAAERDAEYLAAVEAGDSDSGSDNLRELLKVADEGERDAVLKAWLERNPKSAAALQRMVDEAAKAAMPRSVAIEPMVSSKEKLADKPLLKLYHGTDAIFQVFERGRQGVTDFGFLGVVESERHGIFFAENRDFAETFAKSKRGERVVTAFLNIINPFSFQDAQDIIEARGLGDEFSADYDMARWFFTRANQWEAFDGEDGKKFVTWLESKGYDGAIIQEDGIGLPDEPTQDVWVALNPSQIKSADPVTRDDAGNVIPLSQRFNPAKPSILYNPAHDYRFSALEREQEYKPRNADGSLAALQEKWKYVKSAEENRTSDGEKVPPLAYLPRRDEAMEPAVMAVLDDLQLSNTNAAEMLKVLTQGTTPGSDIRLSTSEQAILARWMLRSGRAHEFGLTEDQVIKAMQQLASDAGMVNLQWRQVLDPITRLKQEAEDKTTDAFTKRMGGDADATYDKLQHELDVANGSLKYLLGKGIRGVSNNDVADAEKALESFRSLLAKDGAQTIADAFFRGGEQRKSEAGPLVQGADTVKQELSKLLNEALDAMGIPKAQAKTQDEYQRIAVALGLDDVRSDKLKELDKRIRDRIAEITEVEHSDSTDWGEMMLEQWETVSSHMRNSAVSGATARRVLKQVMKEEDITVSQLLDLARSGQDKVLSRLADIITSRVRQAGSTQDMRNLHKVIKAAGRQIIDTAESNREKARARANDNQKVAEDVIAEFEQKFSGIPSFKDTVKNALRKLVDDAIHAKEIMPDFIERAMRLGVDELTARTLGDMTLEHGRRKAEERDERERAALLKKRQTAIENTIKGLLPKEKKESKRVGKFIRYLTKADELGILDRQVFVDAFAGAFNLNHLTPAVLQQLRDTWRDLTAVNADGVPIHRGMPRETLERRFMESVNAVSPGAKLSNVLFDQYQSAALASISSIINQFSGVFRVLSGVDAFSRSFARGDLRGTVSEWWRNVSDMVYNLPLALTGIRGESLGFSQSQLKTTFKPGEQKLALTGAGQNFRIQHGDGSVTTLTDTQRKLLRAKELWTWRAIRGAEAVSGLTDSQARFRDVLTQHYIKQGMEPAAARQKAWSDIASNEAERARATEQARREQAEGLIGKGEAVIRRRVQEIIAENIEARLGQDLISRVESLTASAQFKTVPTGVLGYPIYRAFHKLAESKNPIAGVARFFFLFGRFLGHTMDTMMAYTPGLHLATLARDNSDSRRTDIIKDLYGSVDAYNEQQKGKAAAGTAFLLANGMLMALAQAMADDDEEPFYQVFGMAPTASRDQKEALTATGKWKEGVVRIFGKDIAYSQIPELAPLFAALGNASDYARFGGQLYSKDGEVRPVQEAAFFGMTDVLMSPLKRSTYKQWFDGINATMKGEETDAWANLATQPIGTALRLPLVVDADKMFREMEGSKDAKGYGQNILRRVPFVHVGNRMFNGYGEQLPSLGTIGMLPPDADVSPEVKRAATINVETGTTRSLPKDPESAKGELTAEQREQYVRAAGRLFVESLLRNEQSVRNAFERGGREAAQKIVSNISAKANKRARQEMGFDD